MSLILRYAKLKSNIALNKTGNVRINVAMRRVRAIIVTEEKLYVLHKVSVYL